MDRREMLDYLKKLNQLQLDTYGDPEINTRISQYEMAYRMQTSVPEVMDLSNEPDWVFDLYGKDSRDPGTYAANCLMARRLLEKDVKFVQLYHQGWDQHNNLPVDIKTNARIQTRQLLR
jgi:streptomycin 6-kinase